MEKRNSIQVVLYIRQPSTKGIHYDSKNVSIILITIILEVFEKRYFVAKKMNDRLVSNPRSRIFIFKVERIVKVIEQL